MFKITVIPNDVYIEKGRGSQYLNFDFLLENPTNKKLEINTIQVSLFDKEDKLILRKLVNKNGMPGSIYTLSNIKLKPNGTLCIFNPFYFFDESLDIKKMQYEFLLDSFEDKKKYRSQITVTPIYYETKANLILPLKERFIVYDGHDFYSHHRRVDLPRLSKEYHADFKYNSSRYAYDFCVVNEKGDLYKAEGKNNEDWFGFGVSVYSPGDGKVVEVVNDMKDNILGKKMFDFKEAYKNPKSFIGNYLVVDHKNGEYSMIGHMKQGSIKVKEGEEVKQGQHIAKMGFSGATANLVHIHYQLCNGPNLLIYEGIPSYFRNFFYIVGSKRIKVKKGQIDTGDIAESCYDKY